MQQPGTGRVRAEDPAHLTQCRKVGQTGVLAGGEEHRRLCRRAGQCLAEFGDLELAAARGGHGVEGAQPGVAAGGVQPGDRVHRLVAGGHGLVRE